MTILDCGVCDALDESFGQLDQVDRVRVVADKQQLSHSLVNELRDETNLSYYVHARVVVLFVLLTPPTTTTTTIITRHHISLVNDVTIERLVQIDLLHHLTVQQTPHEYTRAPARHQYRRRIQTHGRHDQLIVRLHQSAIVVGCGR